MSDKNKEVTSFLYAYAIGCLDNADFLKVLNHIRAGEEYPYQELGEYQNLASLLPSFLEIEVPDQSVKDKVARKLYRLKEQKRPERTTKIVDAEPTTNLTADEEPEEVKPKVDPFAGVVDEDKIRQEFLGAEEVTESEEEIIESPEPMAEAAIEEEASPDYSTSEDFSFSEPEPVSEEVVEEEEEEEETVFKPVTPFSRRSPELNRPKQETQVSSRGKQDIPDRDKYEDEQSDFTISKPEIDPYQSFTSDEKVSSEPTFSTSFESNKSEEKSSDSFSSNYTTDSYSAENSYTPSYSEPERDFNSTSRFQTLNSALSSNSIPEKVVEEKVVEKVVYEKVKAVSPALFIIFTLLLAGGIGAVYYFLNKEIKVLNNSTSERLEKLISANQTSMDYKPLIELITAKSTQVVTLSSNDKNSSSFARLYYNTQSGKGLIKL
ncbi:MAG: hypothetical protein KF721_11765, partial [Ignavibacteriaceae bacterium]|nr:hypothetical protein [Ignavibacteriaceae bacterium]